MKKYRITKVEERVKVHPPKAANTQSQMIHQLKSPTTLNNKNVTPPQFYITTPPSPSLINNLNSPSESEILGNIMKHQSPDTATQQTEPKPLVIRA